MSTPVAVLLFDYLFVEDESALTEFYCQVSVNCSMNIVNYIACFDPEATLGPFLIYPELVLQLTRSSNVVY